MFVSLGLFLRGVSIVFVLIIIFFLVFPYFLRVLFFSYVFQEVSKVSKDVFVPADRVTWSTLRCLLRLYHWSD